jgi:ribose transport system permease protein
MIWRQRNRQEATILLFECAVLLGLLTAWDLLSVRSLGMIDYAFLIVATLPLAFSAMTQTLPILAGGQGLAAGATAYLVSVIVASAAIVDFSSAMLWIGLALLLGAGIGAFNGALIGYLRVPSTAVTFSTSIVAGALAQALSESTTSSPPSPVLGDILFGANIAGLPVVLLGLLAIFLLAGEALRSSRWGHGLRLLGMRPALAERAGVPAARLRMTAYAIAGLGSAITGVVLAAQLGTTDLFLGAPLLLQVYAAVALGGSVPGLRSGSILGSLIGAIIVSATANLLLPLGIDDFFSTAFDGMWLISGIFICWLASRSQRSAFPHAASVIDKSSRSSGFLQFGLGVSLVCLLLWRSSSSDLPFAVLCMALLAFGQGIVIRAGGLDLSMPAVIGFAGVAMTALTNGRLDAVPLALCVILIAAAVAGLWHAWLARRFDRGAIAGTLATAGILQVLTAWLAIRLPVGFAPPELTLLVTSENGTPPLLAWIGWSIILVAAVALDYARTRKARFAGHVSLGATYVLSALCAAIFGIAMAALAGQFHTGLGDTWFAPTLAAIMVGGVSFRQTSGRLIGIIGGVILVQALDTVLVSIGGSSELRLMAFGLVTLVASIIAAQRAQLRSRSSTVLSRESQAPDGGGYVRRMMMAGGLASPPSPSSLHLPGRNRHRSSR